jgi:hypothetical protein
MVQLIIIIIIIIIMLEKTDFNYIGCTLRGH